jgi:hypothetical protein
MHIAKMNDSFGRLIGCDAGLDLDDAGQLPQEVGHKRIQIVDPALARRRVTGDRLS